ncbi:MAG TPA: class I SAM-dependent methyltransferase [Candidatus Eisenbacteria bacterium]|nr:class I SAM-dependent methyltransferase [Candidatus Eisenbacteria bacterium]
MTEIRDRWAAGTTYEAFMGRWSRLLAPAFVAWTAVPAGAHWLDVGCGTGAMTEAICAHADPGSVVGCDPAEPLLEYARSRAAAGRASYLVAGAGELPPRAGGYGCVASLLALNFLPDPDAAIREMRSLAAPNGVVAACVWDYGGRMELLRYFWDAVRGVDPASRGLDEGARFPLCRPEPLTELFRAGGLRDVCCEPIDIATRFSDFDDYWRPFLGGTGPAPTYVASLDDARRAALARRLQQTLPEGAGGSIPLTARAWAVRGTAP